MTAIQIIIISLLGLGYIYSLWYVMPGKPTKKQMNMQMLNMLCVGFIICITIILSSIRNDNYKKSIYEEVPYKLYKLK